MGTQARRADRARPGAPAPLAPRRCAPGGSRPRSATSTRARDTLLGVDAAGRRGPGGIVRGVEPKAVVVDSLIPPVDRALSVGRPSRHARCCRRWSPRSRKATARSSSRTRARRRRSGIRRSSPRGPTGRDRIALHHGSLDREDARLGGGRAARRGALRCVVARRRLDLGVDFSPVDRVLQIGSPKGVARLLQRAGRSGHRPGAVSRVTCVPTNALELIEVAAARDGDGGGRDRGAAAGRAPARRARAARRHRRARRRLPSRTSCCAEVRTTRAYARPAATTSGTGCSTSSPAAARRCARIPSTPRRCVRGRRCTVVTEPHDRARHRMSIGTIVSDAPIIVQYLRGAHARHGGGDRSSRGSGPATVSSSPARRWSSCACAT